MAQQMNEAQVKFVQELEMEMVADMFNKYDNCDLSLLVILLRNYLLVYSC